MSDSTSSSVYFARGGARIGGVNYSWPLASLSADSSSLTIVTTMFGLFEMGSYRFIPDQVTRIERFGSIPLIGEGIRIHHTVTDYPEKVVFWCRPSTVLSGIASVGFSATPVDITSASASPTRGFPLRIWPPVLVVIIWNLLLGYEFFAQPHLAAFPGPRSVVALSFVFCTAVAVLRFPAVQKVFLRPGRSIGEVRPIFLLIATVTGIMALVFTTIYLAGGSRRSPKLSTSWVATADKLPRSLRSVSLAPSCHHI